MPTSLRSSLLVAVLFGCACCRSASASTSYWIVTDTTLVASFAPLAAWHSSHGRPAAVVTTQSIASQYPVAADDAERVRLFLRDAHANDGARYVLLGGDEPLVPVRRALLRLPMLPPPGEVRLPTDQYFACLAGSWNADGDADWGEWPDPSIGETGDDVSTVPDLYVGRAMVSNAIEAQRFVARTLSAWQGAAATSAPDVLLAAAAYGSPGAWWLDFAITTEPLVPALSAIPGAALHRYYVNDGAWPGALPETRAAVLGQLGAATHLAVLSGPGGPSEFQAGVDATEYVTSADGMALTNTTPFVACFMSAYTTQPGGGSLGAAMLHAPAGGAAAVLGPSDIEFTSIGSHFVQLFVEKLVGAPAVTLGEALNEAVVGSALGGPVSDLLRLSMQGNLLLGDPALPAPWTLASPTPVQLSLVSATFEQGAARLRWYAAASFANARVERSVAGSGWTDLGAAQQDEEGYLRFDDATVRAGARYGYRLAVEEQGAVRHSSEAWVTVPALSFGLRAASSNPVRTMPAFEVTLEQGGEAMLEWFDAAGRRLGAQRVAGPGVHTVELARGESPAPGIYLARLRQGTRQAHVRVCVMR